MTWPKSFSGILYWKWLWPLVRNAMWPCGEDFQCWKTALLENCGADTTLTVTHDCSPPHQPCSASSSCQLSHGLDMSPSYAPSQKSVLLLQFCHISVIMDYSPFCHNLMLDCVVASLSIHNLQYRFGHAGYFVILGFFFFCLGLYLRGLEQALLSNGCRLPLVVYQPHDFHGMCEFVVAV